MSEYLDWSKLLSSKRLEPESQNTIHEPRSPFERDCSRIIFTDSFRRLGRKTQVHPLAKNDHIHTRLTHSQEVSVFGNSLACCVWDYMEYLAGEEKNKQAMHRFTKNIKNDSSKCDPIKNGFVTITKNINRSDFALIVQAAGYAHDIGNPPFGHAGEEAIREWMKTHEHFIEKIYQEDKKNDIRYFEGNAQGLRLIIESEGFHENTGLNLTVATIGAMIKYPRTSTESTNKKHKYNYLQSEIKKITSINKALGLNELDNQLHPRHPLSYLMEAADDICYAIIDVEDAMEMNILSVDDIINLLRKIKKEMKKEIKNKKKENKLNSCAKDRLNQAIEVLKNSKGLSVRRSMAKYRSPLMNLLTNQIAISFLENYEEIMKGSLEKDLIDSSDNPILKTILREFKQIAKEKIFEDRIKTQYEVGFNTAIGVLLESFFMAADDLVSNGRSKITTRSKQVLSLMSHHTEISDNDDHYIAYLKVLDFISGMTDNYASYLSKQLHGVFNA